MANQAPCKGCIPPKRQIDCHGYCKEYIKWKAELERQKRVEKEWKVLLPKPSYKSIR